MSERKKQTEAATFMLGSDEDIAAPKKTPRDYQIEAARRLQNMHEASLRLAHALGIPMGGIDV